MIMSYLPEKVNPGKVNKLVSFFEKQSLTDDATNNQIKVIGIY